MAPLAAVALLIASFGHAAETLEVYTWSDYIDPEIVVEFEAEHDVRVRFDHFESDELRDGRLAERGGSGYDIVIVNGSQIDRYAQRHWLAPLDDMTIPNARHVQPRWADAFEGASRYGVPYFWGTLGIAWRSDLWPDGFERWSDLLEPAPALKGQIAMTSYGRELVAIALKAQGDSANESDRERIRLAGERLERQRPSVAGYGYSNLDASAPLVAGSMTAGMFYSGDALVLQELEPSIRYVVPEEGGLVWVDYLTVSASSPRKALAARFIDFLQRPDIAARNALYLYYATPNVAAEALLPDAFRANPLVYPTAEVLRASEFLLPLPVRSRKLVNTIGARVLQDR